MFLKREEKDRQKTNRMMAVPRQQKWNENGRG